MGHPFNDENLGWWRHGSHRRKVAQATHESVQQAIARGRRALRNSRLLELAAKTAGATFVIFFVLWLVLHITWPTR